VRGDTPVDLLVRGTLVDVTNGCLREASVAIDDGTIVALAERPADRVLEGEYIAPGLIDAHMHVESSMVTVPQYGAAVISRGVTAVVTDPHEIANVCGVAGVRGMIDDATKTPLKARFTVPSSVPASPLQPSGAELGVEAVSELLEEDAVVALGEVMNIPGVLAGDETVHGKIDAARKRGLPVDGHAPRVTGEPLQTVARYLDSDHESTTYEEAIAKLQCGMRLYIREGSCSKDLDTLIGLVDDPRVDSRRLSLCSDDRDVVELVELGGVDYAVRRAIEHGVDPVEAIQLATINTAEAYDLPFGRIEPGTPADLVVLDDLEQWVVDHVVVDGVVDPAGAETNATPSDARVPQSEISTDTVSIDPIEPRDLAIAAPDRQSVTVSVIDATERLQTGAMTHTVAATSIQSLGGEPVLGADTAADVLPMSVIDRHEDGEGIGNGFVHGLGLERGAIALTVAHDAHNCLVVGECHDTMADAVNRVAQLGGGIVVIDPECVEPTTLELPIGGLLSPEPLEAVKHQFEAVETAATKLGFDHVGGLHVLTFLALEVIPERRLTSQGLVDVDSFERIDVVRSPSRH